MIGELRARFNAAWTEDRYRDFLARLGGRVGVPIEFPVAETPCFFPRTLIDELAAAGEELTRQAMSGEAGRRGAAIVPARFRGPDVEPHPTFIQVDFGLTRDERGGLAPKLVELQAFPSLYGFQIALAAAYRSAFDLPDDLSCYVGELRDEEYRALAGAAIVGGHDPREVVLMEIAPERQKTRPDFAMTEQLWGVRAVDVGAVKQDGRALFYDRDGVRTRIRRVYNRVIPDELEAKQIALPFDYRDDLDVEWAGHPAWFFRISKFSIPFLQHPSVPRTWFLHDVAGDGDVPALPLPREQLLLKPLFSFAGGGIVFAPTDEQLRAIPRDRRDQYILQERLAFVPTIETPHGPTQVEIRMMYLWTDRLRPVLPLLRLGRGKMMGVDHNKGLRWVGASAGLIEK